MITIRFAADLLEEEMEESIYHAMEDEYGFETYEPFDVDPKDATKVVAQFEGDWAAFIANKNLQNILTQNIPNVEITDEEMH